MDKEKIKKETPIRMRIDYKLNIAIKILAMENEMSVKDLYPQVIRAGYETLKTNSKLIKFGKVKQG